ncbi:MAG TPA: ABC transporter permease [Streptomyces sp.]|nr:ABC transporter permease [Streptomyces sp.]
MSSSITTRTGPAAPSRIRTARGRLLMVLRLHRSAMWIWIAFVVITAAVLLWLRFGPYGTAAAQVQAGCGTSGHRACSSTPLGADALHAFEYSVSNVSSLLRNFAPVVAAWAGGALIARELENGTAELAWTQAISPTRWLAEKLAVPAVLLTAGTGLLMFQFRGLLDWAGDHHLLRAGYETNDLYFAFGPSIVAYVLLGLTIGALTAFLTRGPLPALGISALATWTTSWVINPWRTQIWPTVTDTAKGDGPFGFAATPCEWDQADFKYSIDACLGAQPASRYWPVQLTETGFVLVLAVVAGAAAFWLMRRRTP